MVVFWIVVKSFGFTIGQAIGSTNRRSCDGGAVGHIALVVVMLNIILLRCRLSFHFLVINFTKIDSNLIVIFIIRGLNLFTILGCLQIILVIC